MDTDIKKPTACILKRKEDKNSTLFAGVYINASLLARTMNADQSYIARILAGHREPTLPYAKRLAAALGMSMDAFLDALEERTTLVRSTREKNIKAYETIVKAEDASDNKRRKAGKPVVRRLSSLRVAS